jgi:hypothetical protein
VALGAAGDPLIPEHRHDARHDARLVLRAPSAFHARYVGTHLEAMLRQALVEAGDTHSE